MKYFQAIFVAFTLSFLFFFIVSEVFAANIYLPPGQEPPSQTCAITGGCDPAPSTCWNSASVGSTNCGTACDGGDAWTKYNLIGCRQTAFDRCDNYFREIVDSSCSTADKCQSQPLLQSGRCDCSVGGTYKTCCTGDGNVNGNCTQSGTQDNNWPPEGSCPGGSTTVMCGVSS